MKSLKKFILVNFLFLFIANEVVADRLKDMVSFAGIRTNQLMGYGIVVGLDGTGDSSLGVTLQSMQSTISQFGMNIDTGSLSGTLSATVVRVFPNGNLEIKGQKKLRITEGTEYIRLSGIIRPQDITTTNSVSSAKIAEAQIEYVGAGILDSATKPGWGSKIFRAISPF